MREYMDIIFAFAWFVLLFIDVWNYPEHAVLAMTIMFVLGQQRKNA